MFTMSENIHGISGIKDAVAMESSQKKNDHLYPSMTIHCAVSSAEKRIKQMKNKA
jgi:hypothetical protein